MSKHKRRLIDCFIDDDSDLHLYLVVALLLLVMWFKKYECLRVALLVIFLCVCATPTVYRWSRGIDNTLYQRREDEKFLFKRIKVGSCWRNFLYEYDAANGISIFPFLCEITGAVQVLFSLLLTVFAFAVCFVDGMAILSPYVKPCCYFLFGWQCLLALSMRLVSWRPQKGASTQKEEKINVIRFMKEDYENDKASRAAFRDVKWQIAAEKELKRYCCYKIKGVYHIAERDVAKIEEMLAERYPKTYCGVTADAKGKPFLAVYHKLDNSIVYQAPITKHR